jgi:uncharacterized protein YeaO (DUF488 family)
MMLKLKRAYEPESRSDGTRLLVERLWPRGLSKAALRIDAWLKEAGPSTELRQWFNHDPAKWPAFRARYFRELDSRPEAWRPIVTAARRGAVTLVYSSRDTEHNNAVALKDYLRPKIRKARSG